jgi:hypothetical protein
MQQAIADGACANVWMHFAGVGVTCHGERNKTS